MNKSNDLVNKSIKAINKLIKRRLTNQLPREAI